MQIHRVVDEANGIALATVTGEISLAALQAEVMRVISEPGFDPRVRALVDVRQATSRMSTDEIVILAEAMRVRNQTAKGTRHALLVNLELMRGLYRMFHSFSEAGRFSIGCLNRTRKRCAGSRKWIVGRCGRAENGGRWTENGGQRAEVREVGLQREGPE